MIGDEGFIEHYREEIQTSIEVKNALLAHTQYIHIAPGLPCNTPDCTNVATVARAEHDPEAGVWLVSPICKECTEALAQSYGII